MGGRGWTRTIDPLINISRSLLSYPPGTSLPYSHEPGRENSLKIMQSHTFLQTREDSNPRQRFWRPPCYRCTTGPCNDNLHRLPLRTTFFKYMMVLPKKKITRARAKNKY